MSSKPILGLGLVSRAGVSGLPTRFVGGAFSPSDWTLILEVSMPPKLTDIVAGGAGVSSNEMSQSSLLSTCSADMVGTKSIHDNGVSEGNEEDREERNEVENFQSHCRSEEGASQNGC